MYRKGLAGLAVILPLWFVSGASGGSAGPGFHIVKPETRVEAPAFTLPGIDGGMFDSLKEFNGKIVLLNFWATWCAPCREEMPAFAKLWRKFRDKGLIVVAIDEDRDDGRRARRFANNLDLGFPVLLDPDGVIRKVYEITAFPTTYLIGRDGKFTGKVVGAADWEGSDAEKLLDSLLDNPG